MSTGQGRRLGRIGCQATAVAGALGSGMPPGSTTGDGRGDATAHLAVGTWSWARKLHARDQRQGMTAGSAATREPQKRRSADAISQMVSRGECPWQCCIRPGANPPACHCVQLPSQKGEWHSAEQPGRSSVVGINKSMRRTRKHATARRNSDRRRARMAVDPACDGPSQGKYPTTSDAPATHGRASWRCQLSILANMPIPGAFWQNGLATAKSRPSEPEPPFPPPARPNCLSWLWSRLPRLSSRLPHLPHA